MLDSRAQTARARLAVPPVVQLLQILLASEGAAAPNQIGVVPVVLIFVIR